MALFVLRKPIVQTARMHSHPVGLDVRFPYFMCANSECSGETARMRRLAWAFAGRLCDKYHNLMRWLIYTWYAYFPFFSYESLSVTTLKIQTLLQNLKNKILPRISRRFIFLRESACVPAFLNGINVMTGTGRQKAPYNAYDFQRKNDFCDFRSAL